MFRHITYIIIYLFILFQVVLLFGANKELDSSRVSLVLLHSIVEKTLNLNPLDEYMEPLQAFHVMIANIVKKQPALLTETVDTNRLFAFGMFSVTFFF